MARWNGLFLSVPLLMSRYSHAGSKNNKNFNIFSDTYVVSVCMDLIRSQVQIVSLFYAKIYVYLNLLAWRLYNSIDRKFCSWNIMWEIRRERFNIKRKWVIFMTKGIIIIIENRTLSILVDRSHKQKRTKNKNETFSFVVQITISQCENKIKSTTQ